MIFFNILVSLFLFIYFVTFRSSYLVSALFIYWIYFIQKNYLLKALFDYNPESKYIKIYSILTLIFILYFIIGWLYSLYLVIKYKKILNGTENFYNENGKEILETKRLKRRLDIGFGEIIFMSSLKYEKYEPVIILKNQKGDKFKLKTNSIISEEITGIYLSENLVFPLDDRYIKISDFKNKDTP